MPHSGWLAILKCVECRTNSLAASTHRPSRLAQPLLEMDGVARYLDIAHWNEMDAIRRILAPVDFSDGSLRALQRAWQLSDALSCDVHLLHVLSEPLFAATTVESHRAQMIRLREKLGRLMPPEAESRHTVIREVRIGSAHERIVEYARENNIDLIVMGRHGRSGVVRSVLGSVADRVVRWAPCPVLAVPDAAAPREPNGEAQRPGLADVLEELPPGLDLLKRAVALRATDVHIDPASASNYEVRLRIDGLLQHYCHADNDVAGHLIGQLKTLADLPIAEPFRTLEGRLRLPPEFAQLEARITAAPVTGGEAVSVRIFDREQVFRPLEDLGFSEPALAQVREQIRRGEGIVLVTGPTNAGKTTTVYSMLEALGGHDKNIVSVEDPVEMGAPFIRQINVDAAHGVTMTTGLKTVLRMDPDVVFVGEIRDSDAADIAMRAASSGRFVFSTIHTRDVASTITALRDLGVDNRSMAANLTGIINQRLIRRACVHCGRPRPLDDAERALLAQREVEWEGADVLEAPGCPACRETGYRGRVGVFEAVCGNRPLRNAIAAGASEDELRALIRERGTASLADDALQKAHDRITTATEALQLRWL